MSIFLILGLLVCIESPGSSAVSHVFVLKGEDVRLDVQKPDLLKGDIHFFLWSFKNEHTVVTLASNTEPIVHENYIGRVEVSTEDYSLRLKNLQEADSGVYTALMSGDQNHIVAEYNVTVQGSERVSGISVCLVRTVLLSVGLIIMVSAVISVHLLDRRRKQE